MFDSEDGEVSQNDDDDAMRGSTTTTTILSAENVEKLLSNEMQSFDDAMEIVDQEWIDIKLI